MKKQINPTIKAHLIRGAFYLLLLLAVCAIPFALAQRHARQSAGQPKRNALAPSVAASALAPKPVPNSSHGKSTSAALSGSASKANAPQKAAQAVQSRAVDAASSVGAPGMRSLQIHKSPLRLTGNLLWYNGDFDGVNGLANERNTSLGSGQYASVYDDFIVPAGPGWDVGSVFSNNLENTNVTGATWEIRQGISEGNGGTLIASGTTVTPVVTPTGRSGFGFTEFMVEVTGLSVHLPPGTYWLNVTVTGDLSGRSFDSTTVGANCVGTPCGNNQNAFFDSNFFGVVFGPTSDQGQPTDFSMGITTGGGGGTPTPTPTGTPACLVVNGGFETGSLPPWTNTGDTSFTGVGSGGIQHSGTFALFTGPVDQRRFY